MGPAKGGLFIVIGVLILWLAATGRFANIKAGWAALKGSAPDLAPAPGRFDPMNRYQPGAGATPAPLLPDLNAWGNQFLR